MKRVILLAITSLAAIAGALFWGSNAGAQGSGDSAPNSYVRLQPDTPGTAQNGNANITGTMKAGTLSGSGAALTNLTPGNINSAGAVAGQSPTYNGSIVAWGNPAAGSLTLPMTLQTSAPNNNLLTITNSATTGPSGAAIFTTDSVDSNAIAVVGMYMASAGNGIGGAFVSNGKRVRPARSKHWGWHRGPFRSLWVEQLGRHRACKQLHRGQFGRQLRSRGRRRDWRKRLRQSALWNNIRRQIY